VEVAAGAKDCEESQEEETNAAVQVRDAAAAVRGALPGPALRVLVWRGGEERALDERVVRGVVERRADKDGREEEAGMLDLGGVECVPVAEERERVGQLGQAGRHLHLVKRLAGQLI
jgi:hypothetical protein